MTALRNQRTRYLLAGVLAVILLSVLFYANQTRGATYTWDGGGADNNWSTCANWTSDTCPGSGDIAKFDSSTTTDSVVDASFGGSVAGIDVNSGYTGTITQERNLTIGSSHFNQADGAWKQSTTTFDINDGSFTLSGGIFETGVGTSTVERNFTISGGTYTASSTSTVTLDGSSSADDTTLSCSGDLGEKIDIAKSYKYAEFTLASSCNATTSGSTVNTGPIRVDGTLHFASNVDINEGNFTNNGTTTMDGTDFDADLNFTQNGYIDFPSTTINLVSGDDATVTCTDELGVPLNFAKSSEYHQTYLSADCIATSTSNISNTGSIIVYGTLHFNGNVDINNGSFSNSGTTTMSGSTFNVERNFTQDGVFDLTNITLTFDGSGGDDDGTLSCSGNPEGVPNIVIQRADQYGGFSLHANCTATSTSENNNGWISVNGTLNDTGSIMNSNYRITVNGTLHLAGDINVDHNNTAGDFINNGTTTMEGTSITIDEDFTQNGVFNLTGVTITLVSGDDATVSCNGELGGTLIVAKTSQYHQTGISSGCAVTGGTSTSPSSIGISGTWSTEGNTLTADTGLSVNTGGALRVHGDETLTSPSIGEDAIIEYYGSGTYPSLIAGTDYEHLQFTGGGTYNTSSDITVEDDFTSTNDSSFNQTSGTFTLDGGTQTVTGTSTFNNFTKTTTATNTVFFGAGEEQTVGGTFTLQGDSDSTLYLKSTATGTQWKMDMQGLRTIEYLTISDGNNTNFSFTADPDGGYLYWDGGGGDNNWSTCANWKFDTCPTATEAAAFDDRNTSNSTLDASFAGEVKGLSIESGYTGTITSNRSLTVGTDGFTLQEGTFTAPTSTLSINGNFTHADGVFSDNNGSVEFTSDGTLTATTNTTLHDVTLGGAPYAESLSAYWKFDEGSGSSAADSSGNGNNGTLQNMEDADWSTSDKASLPISNAASLGTNASDEYVSVNVDLGTEWTIAIWFKWPLDNNGGSWNTLTRGNDDHQVIVRRSDNLLGTYDNDGGAAFVSSGYDMDNLSIGWHHLAAAGSGSQTEFYIDGTSVGTAANKSTTDIIAVGNYQGGGQSWGRMDDFRIYSVALTTEQIDTLINGSPVSLDLSGATLDIDGAMTINENSILDTSLSNCSSSSCDIEVAGNWTNNGTFEARDSTVTFNGTNQTISGDTTFNNFTKSVTSADTIIFGAGNTQTVSGTFTLKGTSGNLLTVNSSSPGTQWRINANPYNSTVEYVDLTDSHSVSTKDSMYCHPGCTDGDNNTNWIFQPRPASEQKLHLNGVRLQGGMRFGGN